MREECTAGESRSTGRETSFRSATAWKRPGQEGLKGYNIDAEQDGVPGTMKMGFHRSGGNRHFDLSRQAISRNRFAAASSSRDARRTRPAVEEL